MSGGTTVLVDLVDRDDEAGLALANAALGGSLCSHEGPWVFVVAENGLLASSLGKSPSTLVTLPETSRPADRWGAGVQTVGAGRVIVLPDPEALSVLTQADLAPQIETDVLLFARKDQGTGEVRRGAGFLIDHYTATRGFDIRITDPEVVLEDLVRRIAAVSGQQATLEGELAAPRVVKAANAKPPTVVANLPVWRHRPPSAAPLVTVLVVVDSMDFEKDCLSAIKAQQFDDLEILVVDFTRSAGVQEWVAHNERSFPRFGILDDITYVSVDADPVSLSRVASLIRGRYCLLLHASDLVLPWAMETGLRRLRPGTVGITGRRVHFDDASGAVSPEASKWSDSVGLIKSDAVRWHLLFGLTDGVTPGTWPAIRGQIGGLETDLTIFALSKKADAAPSNAAAWKAPGSVDRLQRVANYLPDRLIRRQITFRHHTVGKVDEIDAYDRVAGTISMFNPLGQLVQEETIVHSARYVDMARLARARIPFEIDAIAGSTQWPALLRDRLSVKLEEHLRRLPAGRLLSVRSVDCVGGATSSDQDGLLGWVSYAEAGRPPLNLCLTNLLREVAEQQLESQEVAGQIYWSLEPLTKGIDE